MADTALITLDEARAEIDTTGTERDELLVALIGRATALIEDELGAPVVSRGSITEYHPRDPDVPIGPNLYTIGRPIIAVTSVHEDISRAYGAATLLTEDTDYIVVKPAGKLVRLSGNLRSTWSLTWRAVKVVYTCGYANTAAVPKSLKNECAKLVAAMYREIDRKVQNVASLGDAAGTMSRFSAAFLTEDMRRALRPHRVIDFDTTGERDS